MGKYLSLQIANIIIANKGKYTKEEVLEMLKEKIDLDIYEVKEEEEFLFLSLKKEIFCKEITKLMKEITQYAEKEQKMYLNERIKELENIKEYEQVMSIASEEKDGFKIARERLFNNDISYLLDNKNLACFCEGVSLLSKEGQYISYYGDMFNYFRENIIANLYSKLKTALVVVVY